MGMLDWLTGSGAQLPPDRLRISQLGAALAAGACATGVPAGADACAHEPTQRLVAVRCPGSQQLHAVHGRAPCRPALTQQELPFDLHAPAADR